MNKRIAIGILIAAAAVGIAIAAGVYEYHAGYAEGLAAGAKVTPSSPGVPPLPYGDWAWRPYVHRGPFGFFGFFIPILLLFLVFGLLRWMFWGGWGRPYGWWRGTPPPTLEEWHRRAHEGMTQSQP